MLNQPYDHPASREFFEVGNEVIRQAAKSGQLIELFSPEGILLPEEAKKKNGFPVITLSVWKSLQSLYRFTYTGLHRQALRDSNKWMVPYQEKHLSYVVWWTEKSKDTSWKDAFKRYNHYIKNGPTPYAFDFKQVFDEKGDPYLLK
ncbi:DUF3291 domain-containing protein [Rummeliibacillus sp. JY-2-4R]